MPEEETLQIAPRYSPVPIIGTPSIGTKREKIQLLEPIFGFLRSGGKNNYWNFWQLLELFTTIGRSPSSKLTHIRTFLHKFSASLLVWLVYSLEFGLESPLSSLWGSFLDILEMSKNNDRKNFQHLKIYLG